MSAQSRIFHREAERLLQMATNALEEALAYMQDIELATADTAVAEELTEQALDLTHGADMALAGVQLDSNDERH